MPEALVAPPLPDAIAHLRGREEDLLDRWFHRKLAHPVALLGRRLGVHPNAVSVLGMVLGAAAGWFFRSPETATAAWGVLLLFVATILDNADGQLARLTGKSSELGYILDGVCDNVVFIGIYSFALAGLWPDYGWAALPLVVLAGVSHSFQSAMLDFYKLEYKYWALGSDGHRFQGPAELAAERARAKPLLRAFLGLRMNHVRQQMALARARLAAAPRFAARRGSVAFAESYARASLPPLRGWFLLGPNGHVIPLTLCALGGRIDLYFWLVLTVSNALLAALVVWQARCDARLAEAAVPEASAVGTPAAAS